MPKNEGMKEILKILHCRGIDKYKHEDSNVDSRKEIDQAEAAILALLPSGAELLEVIDKTLGYEGIGTKFTSKEINKIKHAVSALYRKKLGGE